MANSLNNLRRDEIAGNKMRVDRQVDFIVMCDYCDNTEKIETDNNGAIVDCPIREFERNLINKQEPLGEEFQKVLDDNYWDLITDT